MATSNTHSRPPKSDIDIRPKSQGATSTPICNGRLSVCTRRQILDRNGRTGHCLSAVDVSLKIVTNSEADWLPGFDSGICGAVWPPKINVSVDYVIGLLRAAQHRPQLLTRNSQPKLTRRNICSRHFHSGYDAASLERLSTAASHCRPVSMLGPMFRGASIRFEPWSMTHRTTHKICTFVLPCRFRSDRFRTRKLRKARAGASDQVIRQWNRLDWFS